MTNKSHVWVALLAIVIGSGVAMIGQRRTFAFHPFRTALGAQQSPNLPEIDPTLFLRLRSEKVAPEGATESQDAGV
jgi:hypothetical protein